MSHLIQFKFPSFFQGVFSYPISTFNSLGRPTEWVKSMSFSFVFKGVVSGCIALFVYHYIKNLNSSQTSTNSGSSLTGRATRPQKNSKDSQQERDNLS